MDWSGDGGGTVQDDDVMCRLKASYTYNRKKMGVLREHLDSGSTSNGVNERSQTQKELLERVVRVITKISSLIGTGSTDLVSAVKFQNEVYDKRL